MRVVDFRIKKIIFYKLLELFKSGMSCFWTEWVFLSLERFVRRSSVKGGCELRIELDFF